MLAIAGGILLALVVVAYWRQVVLAFLVLLVGAILCAALLPVLGRL